MFPERVNIFPSLLFLSLLSTTASVAVHILISVLGLHLIEEITVSVNSETEIIL